MKHEFYGIMQRPKFNIGSIIIYIYIFGQDFRTFIIFSTPKVWYAFISKVRNINYYAMDWNYTPYILQLISVFV